MGNFVHLTFERKDALWCTESSKRAVRRNVGRNSAAVNSYVRTEVWPSRMNRPTRKHNRRKRAISAAVDHKLDLHREELAVPGNSGLVPRARRMALCGSDHVFGSVVDDLHRLA